MLQVFRVKEQLENNHLDDLSDELVSLIEDPVGIEVC